MSFGFRLAGKIVLEPSPAASVPSGEAVVKIDLLEEGTSSAYVTSVVSLGGDDPEEISLGDLDGAEICIVRVVSQLGGKVLASFTHADGSAQVIPVDPLFVLISATSQITALSIQRTPGVETTVHVLFARKSS